ncbi:MAG: phosphotransferase [Planctomycetota bacterium]|nr:phosphotransferase [Planctomycetota bacterium]
MSTAEYARDLPVKQLEAALARYDLACGPERELGGGTASPKVIVGAKPNRYLLRRRRKEFSAPEVVAYDHAVIGKLAADGFPVVPPLRARDGRTAVWIEAWAFEAFPFKEGLERFDPGSLDELAQAGDLLGRMHAALEAFTPPGRKDWPREFRMATNLPVLEAALAAQPGAPAAQTALARRMLEAGRRVAAELTDARYAALPHTIVHGDYTWANLTFQRGKLAGVFDFDWTYRQARLDDVNRAVLFLAFPRASGFDDASIWSLVEPYVCDRARARIFLEAYAARHAFTPEERALLPWYLRETFLSCRIRAMRKVPDERKLEILTFGMGPLLERWAELDELLR